MKARSAASDKITVPDEVMDKIEAAVREIGYGSVTLIVQDSRIIQMEKFEKIRL